MKSCDLPNEIKQDFVESVGSPWNCTECGTTVEAAKDACPNCGADWFLGIPRSAYTNHQPLYYPGWL